MPPTKRWSSADFDAVIAQVTPDVVALLGDGVPRTMGTIIAALADRHPKDDVRRTLMRLAVTEQLPSSWSRPAASTPCRNLDRRRAEPWVPGWRRLEGAGTTAPDQGLAAR